MLRIKVPATSANLGPGFDTLGLALACYNTFDVALSNELELTGIPCEFSGPDNLFAQAYAATRELIPAEKRPRQASVKAHFQADIPISRGLGSSAALLVGGAVAANELAGSPLSDDDIFQICTRFEGHPDNVAPAVFGGMTASFVAEDGVAITSQIPMSDQLYFTAFIPDFAVPTAQARAVMPRQLPVQDAVFSMSRAISLIAALGPGGLPAEPTQAAQRLRELTKDKIHQPYRQRLIPDWPELLKRVHQAGGALAVSGSGSTCLGISVGQPLGPQVDLAGLEANWRALDLPLHLGGPIVEDLAGENEAK
ncbi:homoserine kinase [Boudabousia tangfeifanii]|uniref:Homoserine kinase n=1 Tax=Boudabousia tangfeifanii TaxID=1912795 RepID=A0A1D9MIH1_9ACTO|nr:homoserine kinase [Boudabousia tangfeifanii]AOZ71990.1 homoserine kinase [Boudabousia tangfeifanii]